MSETITEVEAEAEASEEIIETAPEEPETAPEEAPKAPPMPGSGSLDKFTREYLDTLWDAVLVQALAAQRGDGDAWIKARADVKAVQAVIDAQQERVIRSAR